MVNLSEPAADLLGANTARILLALHRVSAGLTGRRISAVTEVPPASANRVLSELREIGLVTGESAGSGTLYRLNRAHLLWEPIERMLATPAHVEQLIGSIVHDAVGDRATVAVYGSFARGEAGRDSDADILIIWNDDVTQSSRDEIIDELVERVGTSTGNAAQVVALTRDDLRRLVRSEDPLVESWRSDAKTIFGPDLRLRLRMDGE
jgi:predicted nucleotidyltransferase